MQDIIYFTPCMSEGAGLKTKKISVPVSFSLRFPLEVDTYITGRVRIYFITRVTAFSVVPSRRLYFAVDTPSCQQLSSKVHAELLGTGCVSMSTAISSGLPVVFGSLSRNSACCQTVLYMGGREARVGG